MDRRDDEGPWALGMYTFHPAHEQELTAQSAPRIRMVAHNDPRDDFTFTLTSGTAILPGLRESEVVAVLLGRGIELPEHLVEAAKVYGVVDMVDPLALSD